MILTSLYLVLAVALISSNQSISGQLLQQQESSSLVQDLTASLQQQQQQHQQQPQHQQQQQATTRQPKQVEILVQPNALVRIECRLPALIAQSNKSRTFYWNFQRTSIQDQKPDLLYYGTDYINAGSYGIELDFDQASGAYDLVINNATYELNDGIYYCDYRDTAPESRQIINREFRLTVLIPPQAPSIATTSAAPAREGQEYQLNCMSFGGNPEPNITWFKNHDQQLIAGAGVRVEQVRQNGTTTSVLTWIPTIDDHQANFKCSVTNKAMNGMAPLERDVTLQVEYAPRITLGPYNPLKVMQGDRATLSCQVDANPPVKGIRWLKDGHQLISNQYNHTIYEIKISDASVYSCQADNGIAPVLLGPANALMGGGGASSANASPTGSSIFSFLGFSPQVSGTSSSTYGQLDQLQQQQQQSKTLVEARLQLEVLYAPKVQIRESRAQPLAEGSYYFTLNCSVDSWPPAYEFVWTKQEDATTSRRLTSSSSSSSSPTLEFNSISSSDMGNYTCTAYNRLEPSGGSNGLAQQVFERQGSASHTILVRHKPGLAELVAGTNGETELGNQTQIQCRVKPPGYPEPKYTFWKWSSSSNGNGGTGGAKNILSKSVPNSIHTIFAAKSEDEGKYGCLAVNELSSSSEAMGDLIVNEPPKIIVEQTWLNEDARQPGFNGYSLTIRASGKPEPRLTWFHRSPVDGRRIDLSSPEMQSKFRIETQSTPEQVGALSRQQQQHMQRQEGSSGRTHGGAGKPRYIVLSTLYFKTPLEVDDRGLYSVEASNGLSQIAVQYHKLHINHSPIAAIRNMPIVSPASNQAHKSPLSSLSPSSAVVTRAGFNVGEMVNLTCRVSAYPKPNFVWHSQTNGGMEKIIDNEPQRYHATDYNVDDDIWESSLTFELTSENDYGDYMCVSANLDTQTQVISDNIRNIIHLNRKSVPEPPLQVEQIDATQDSVTLRWIPGFDGGYAQNQFTVQFAPDDNSGLSLMSRYGPLIATDQINGNLQDNLQSGDTLLQQQQQVDQQQQQQQQQQQYPKLYDCLSMNPCTINNLLPRQAYLMRLRAQNVLGSSKFTDDLRVSTRANVSQVPRIQEAHFDSSKNILRFRVEPNPEYLLNNLEARIEGRGPAAAAAAAATVNGNSLALDQQQQQQSTGYTTDQQQQDLAALPSTASEWRRYPSVPVRNEQGEVYLNIQPDSEQLRLTLCSRLNESLCGPEFVLSTQSVTSSFLQDQRGLSISILASTLILIVVLGGFATTVHSCCLSRKAKKVAALDGGADSNGHHQPDNKPALGGHINGGLSLANGNAPIATVNVNGINKIGSHGSTTSTNSTSANGNIGASQLQSMDSINNGHHNGGSGSGSGGGGSASDHSSDHSRQAKLDSMLPPNYSHYADRASLMLEQHQQHQQQQQQQQQQAVAPAYLQDMMGSPFGLPASAMLHPQMDPTMSDYFGTGMAYHHDPSSSAVMSSLEHQLDNQQQQQQQQQQNNSMTLNSMLGSSLYDQSGQLDSMYSTSAHHHQQQQQQLVDEYNNYNQSLAYANQQQHDQMLESAYGTTTGVPAPPPPQVPSSGLMMAQPTQASYDNTANQSYCHQSYLSPASDFDQQQQQQQQQQLDSNSSQYQQDLAAAQQQMYGTLTRNNNNNSNNATNTSSSATPNNQHDQYMAAAAGGLMPPPPPPPQGQLESDYGTTGTGRGGRLIREIIV